MNLKYFENLIRQKLLGLHTCYLAKAISINGSYATVQPLAMIKAYGESPKKQAVIENVPIAKHAVEDVQVDSTVICICAERDITQTKFGRFALPSLRHHSLSDSIIIGVLEV